MNDAERVEVIREIKAERVRLSREEREGLKADLLAFVHNVAQGDFNTPEQVNALCPVAELVARFF